MVSLFDEWNIEKQKIHTRTLSQFYIKPREIWFTRMGVNIGYEQNGKAGFGRPVLVIKKLGSLFLTIALTTKGKPHGYFYRKIKHPNFTVDHKQNSERCWMVTSQVKVMDKRRFEEKIGRINQDEFLDIKKELRDIWL